MEKRMLTCKCLKCYDMLASPFLSDPRSTQGSRVAPITTQNDSSFFFFAKILEMIRCSRMHVCIEHSFSATINQVFLFNFTQHLRHPFRTCRTSDFWSSRFSHWLWSAGHMSEQNESVHPYLMTNKIIQKTHIREKDTSSMPYRLMTCWYLYIKI